MTMLAGYRSPRGDSRDARYSSDLDDLDPLTSRGRKSPAQKLDRIPLRRLGFMKKERDEDAEELESLVGDDDDQNARVSGVSSCIGAEDNPLLADRGSEPQEYGLRRYLPFVGRKTSVRLPIDEPGSGSSRNVLVGQKQAIKYPPNAVSNAKYTPLSFLPRTLWNEFKFFFNLYFLLVALSQIFPALRIGYLSTYIAPLAFVVMITLGKEAHDDIYRRKRDREANSEMYKVLTFGVRRGSSRDSDETLDGHVPSASVSEAMKPSRDLKVGDIVVLSKEQRVPADVVILKSFSGDSALESAPKLEQEAADAAELDNNTTSDDPSGGGEAFIRTDQLDGETDWKLRLASPLAQTLPPSEYVRLQIMAGKPEKNVTAFAGTVEQKGSDQDKSGPLTIDNTAWANTVLASSSTVHAVVVYTGPQTRAALSTSASRSKTGLLENEINNLTKILCFLTAALSLLLVLLERVESTEKRKWYVDFMRFLILFSTIVPISLRVNLDMGKSAYARFIQRDAGIPGTVVRTSTIPEDLGRIDYLLTDKTGTLTRNEMELRKLHVGTVSYGGDAMEEVSTYIKQAFAMDDAGGSLFTPSNGMGSLGNMARTKREISTRIRNVVLALALCHNVTPTTSEEDGQQVTTYQASSPDEIAIVQWTEGVGLRLAHRDRKTITLQSSHSGNIIVKVDVLNVFPFTSESKRMGIIVRFHQTDGEGDILFLQKGADTIMSSIVAANDWLDEETSNMAREGLRTLVVGRKALSKDQYAAFSSAYTSASLSLTDREATQARVVSDHLEKDLDLLGVTGVEDKLQANVKPSLELLRNAGIKIWMLTGDKVETARCVAIASKLVSRGQHIHTITGITQKDSALDALHILHNRPTSALLIDGQSLSLYLTYHSGAFISAAVKMPSVIACRCSPTQKAEIASLIRSHTRKRVACIGDGGNDVSMIQAADVGVGIVGKEGRQASLAADFSVTQFSFLTKLLLWHGRNSYKRSAKLAQFVMHRGLIISVCQTVYSISSHFEPVALYRDWLLVGYATVYTMAPVFSLVLDRDVDENLAELYPELYRELTLGKSLSYRSFFGWVAISLYQGLIIQGGASLLLGEKAPFNKLVAVSYTVLVLNEIFMVAVEITTWHPVMIVSILGTMLLFLGSFPALGDYFDLGYLVTVAFVWRCVAIGAASLIPVAGGKWIHRTIKPPSYRKVQGV
ncbi:phospholipid-translocating P-type ATPase [Piedraia hortae CBS 480.64]|uniref:Phospholipid-transporting ATPase n=1 Tax=Piedraia hortae CBS 480.64 TaxID=1314780 RepID=A0A6A7BUH9_9PEZI|nr:phospholipid-translocating P-type ATPase [Piedraia hortae CBS 480.64]